MPTVLRVGPYRFYFSAGDRLEPPHVHVEREGIVTKFWLDPVRLEPGSRFRRTELNRIQDIVDENREQLLRSWNVFFSD